MMYERSRAIAQREKMALAAMGLARSSRPGRMLTNVVSHTPRSGVLVEAATCPK